MTSWQKIFRKNNFYLIVGLLNVFSVSLLFYYNNPPVVSSSSAVTMPMTPKVISKQAISGKPVLLRIPSINLELPIDEGYYNPADAIWTLSGYHAHFAMPTTLANNEAGNTLLYGHNNKYVFGPLKKLQPGAVAEIITDNGHQFYYTFETVTTIQPDDVSIFSYEGPPILTLQTCTGNWHELRTMSTFKLSRVVKYNPNAVQDKISREKLMTDLDNLSNPSYPEAPIIR